MDDLIKRLRGTYSLGPFGERSFEEFIPAISKEAAAEIERLRMALTAIAKTEKFEGIPAQAYKNIARAALSTAG